MTIKRIWLLLICLMAMCTLGCGSSEDTANGLADPTNQLPFHQNWNSYNLYRFDAPSNNWVKIVNLGAAVEGAPALGLHPAILVHGLGGSIRSNTLTPLAQNLLSQNRATAVFGFEYDTLDGINNNSTFFSQAIGFLNPGNTHPLWTMVGHSMGGLVIRASVQTNTLPIGTLSKVVTIATPHFGSPVANAVQGANAVNQALFVTVLNQGGFTNADGNPSEVPLSSQGITDLRTDSLFLGILNAVGNIDNHPQVNYYTLAGTNKGAYSTLNDVLNVQTDDGFVTVASANPPELSPIFTGIVNADHTQIISDSRTFDLINSFLP